LIKCHPNQVNNRGIFIRNVSNENSSIILKEKYFAESNPQINNLNDLFKDSFLKINEKFLFNYNKGINLESSHLNKIDKNSFVISNNNNSTNFISKSINNSINLRKSNNNVNLIERKNHRRTFSMFNIKQQGIFYVIYKNFKRLIQIKFLKYIIGS